MTLGFGLPGTPAHCWLLLVPRLPPRSRGLRSARSRAALRGQLGGAVAADWLRGCTRPGSPWTRGRRSRAVLARAQGWAARTLHRPYGV